MQVGVIGLGRMGANFDLAEIAEVWRRGSVVASWLLDLTAAALASDPTLERFTGRVSDSGEGRWTLDSAMRFEFGGHAEGGPRR